MIGGIIIQGLQEQKEREQDVRHLLRNKLKLTRNEYLVAELLRLCRASFHEGVKVGIKEERNSTVQEEYMSNHVNPISNVLFPLLEDTRESGYRSVFARE